MFSFGAQQQQQSSPAFSSFGSQQPQSASLLPSITPHTISPHPYPRDTPFDSLPVEVRNALEALERVIRQTTHSAKHLDASRDYSAATNAATRLHEYRDWLARVEVKQQSTRTQLSVCRRLVGQYWRYSEAVAASFGFSSNPGPNPQNNTLPTSTTPNAISPNSKYANLQLPPYDLQLFERIVDRLDGLTAEAESAAVSLRQELEYRSKDTVIAHEDANIDQAMAIVNQQVLLRELREKVISVSTELEEDRRAFRAFMIKYKNDSSDPFQRPDQTKRL